MIDLRMLHLQTPRVTVRPITAMDLDALFAVYSDPEVMRYTSDPPFDDPALMQQFWASVQQGYASGAYYELALEHRRDGTCSLHSFDTEQSAAEVGFLLQRAYWRQGLMAEALGVLLGFCFDTLRFQTIYADVDAPNAPSRALISRLGFQPVADHPTLFALAPELLRR